MAPDSVLRELLGSVLQKRDLDQALQAVADAAIRATRSRNALIAILDLEAGHLEIRNGAGPDWVHETAGKILQVSTGQREGITAYVAATGKSFLTGDVAEEPSYHQLFATTKSELAVPVHDPEGRLVAVLNLESDHPHHFSAAESRIAEEIALVLALVLERFAAHDREEALLEIGTAIDDVMDETELTERVIDVAGRVLHLQACSIFLFDPRTQSFVLRASTGALRSKIGELSYAPGEGFTGWVCQTGKPILLDRPQTDPRWRGKYTEFPSVEIASFLAVPIVIRGKSIGVIRALRRIPQNEHLDNRFNDSDLRLLQAIADQTAVALDSVRAIEKLVHSERMSAWGELSAKSSHMIGNRVFALRGDVNELGHLIGEAAPGHEPLLDIHRSLTTNVTRLQELLQDFRDFVTATQLSKRLGDLNAFVRATVDEVFPKRSDIGVHLILDPDLPPVSFDPMKLRLALSELIENALSFPSGGSLWIRTAPAQESPSGQPLGPIDRFVQIEVEDDGPGVEPAMKEAIFQPFFTSRVKGMGLGLSIVKGIVEAHGGTVIEVGEPGRGAKFVMLLPVAERQSAGGS